jgi:AcrR family transcriptional regulator
LLQRCIEAVEQHGFSDLSLREMAAAVGTSHRMLIYHFGTRDGLLVEIVGRIEAEQREVLAELAGEDGDIVAVSRAFWRRISDPALAPAERLFFEVYSHAMRGRPWTASFRESVIAAWDEPLTSLFRRHGFGRAESSKRARLALAVARGLLLDLLITDDRRQVTAAADLFVRLVTAPPATTRATQAPGRRSARRRAP